MLLMEGGRLHENLCSFGRAVIQAPCSLFAVGAAPASVDDVGHHYHEIDVLMNSIGGLIADYKSAVASVMCMVAPMCNPLADTCPLVVGQYLRSVSQRSLSQYLYYCAFV